MKKTSGRERERERGVGRGRKRDSGVKKMRGRKLWDIEREGGVRGEGEGGGMR